MLEALPWLPPPSGGELEEALSDTGREWLSRWVVERSAWTAMETDCMASDSLQWFGDPVAVVGVTAEQLLLLGNRIVASLADLRNPHDTELLRAIGCAAVKDLARQLCPLADVEIAGPQDRLASLRPGGYRLSESQTGFWLQLQLDPVTSTRLRREWAGSRAQPSLTAVSVAVAHDEVELGCHLGTVVLTAAELAELTRGDLLVLSRCLDDDLPLTVERRVVAGGSARITAEGDSCTVEINQPGERSLVEAEAQ